MKKFLTIILLTVSITASAFVSNRPCALAIHPTEPLLIVGHERGIITLVDAKTFKVKESKRIGTEIKKIAYSPDGKKLWVLGSTHENRYAELFSLSTTDWSIDFNKRIAYAVWSNVNGRICYKASSFDKQVVLLDMNSSEKIGGINASFTDSECKLDGMFISSNGKDIFLCGKKGYDLDAPGEVLVYSSEGFQTNPLKKIKVEKSLSDSNGSFGNGACTYDSSYVVIGWFNGIKFNENESTKLTNWNSCYSVFCSTDGSLIIASTGKDAAKIDPEKMTHSKITVEEIGNASGDITAFASSNNKEVYFVTNEHMIGCINEQGFVTNQKVLDYKVNVYLRDNYSKEDIEKIESKLSSAGYKVKLPEESDFKNRPLILKEVTVSKGCGAVKTIREKTSYNVQTIAEIAFEE